jgi:hypothetical protein
MFWQTSLAREFGKKMGFNFSGSLGNLISNMLSVMPCLSDLHENMIKNPTKKDKYARFLTAAMLKILAKLAIPTHSIFENQNR